MTWATSGERRSRLAVLMMSRRFLAVRGRVLGVRALALALLALLALTSDRRFAALSLMLPALLALLLSIRVVRPVDGSGPALQAPGDGRYGAGSLRAVWTAAAALLIAVPSWILTDLSPLVRSVGLTAVMVVVVSTVTDALVSPRWFDPTVPDRPGLEVLRRVATHLLAAASTVLVLLGPWPDGLTIAGFALGLLPLVSTLRLFHLEQVLQQVIPVIRQSGQQGRDQVLREIHGTLSTELRQLEQYARQTRKEAPAAYELAVNANSSLRETLTLTDESRETSTTTDTLLASVLTLARAVGASASAQIEVQDLSLRDREVARYVLNELAGQALKAGAFHLSLSVRRDSRWVEVELHSMGAVSSSSVPPGQLDLKLAALSGNVAREALSDSTVDRARWPPRP